MSSSKEIRNGKTDKLTPLTFVDVKLNGCHWFVELGPPVVVGGGRGAGEVGKGNCAARPRWRKLHFLAATLTCACNSKDIERIRRSNACGILNPVRVRGMRT